MNKFFTISLLLIPVFIFSQSQRTILIEEGSNASCGPCAQQNPGFHSLMQPNIDDSTVVMIKYQWYYPGYDPMYEHNPLEHDGRFNGYYNQSGVPTAFIDGKVPTRANTNNAFDPSNAGWYAGACGGFSQTLVDNRSQVTSPFDLDIKAQLSSDFKTIEVSVGVEASEIITNNNNLKLRIAVIEKHIKFDTAPGTNGEKDFYNIMKKLLPNMGGTNLPNTFAIGDSLSFHESWIHENVYDLTDLAVVAFVQDDDNKEVLQAKKVDVDYSFAQQNSIAIVNMTLVDESNLDSSICDYKIFPKVEIMNLGSNDLTSCIVEYSVNDGSTQTYNWSGSITSLGKEVIELPEVYYFHSLSEVNVTSLEVKLPNQVQDAVVSDDTITGTFKQAQRVSPNIEMYLSHDQYGSEVTWNLTNSAGTILYNGGPYPDAAGIVRDTFELLNNDCYTFEINDSYGDGQLGNNVGVRLTDIDNSVEILPLVADYAKKGVVNFGLSPESSALYPDSAIVYTSIKDFEVLSSLKVYPNPATNVINIELENLTNEDLTFNIVDVTGRIIDQKIADNNQMFFDLSAVTSGFYFLTVSSNTKLVATESFVVK